MHNVARRNKEFDVVPQQYQQQRHQPQVEFLYLLPRNRLCSRLTLSTQTKVSPLTFVFVSMFALPRIRICFMFLTSHDPSSVNMHFFYCSVHISVIVFVFSLFLRVALFP